MFENCYFANILISNELASGRKKVPRRKGADWFHSIAVFTSCNIRFLRKTIPCIIIHFYGIKGAPVLDVSHTYISYHSTHQKENIYILDSYKNCYASIGTILTENTEEDSVGFSVYEFDIINGLAQSKWGNNNIPYTHNRKESYNCAGFTDDILHMCKYGKWNDRIVNNHNNYRLST
jgi:hypothetical protein